MPRRLRPDRKGTGGHLSTVTVRPVVTKADLKQFIDLPYLLNARDPIWVPPLRMDVSTILDRKKNPFFEHAVAEYFLAERDGKVVGRVAANHNALHVGHNNSSAPIGRSIRTSTSKSRALSRQPIGNARNRNSIVRVERGDASAGREVS